MKCHFDISLPHNFMESMLHRYVFRKGPRLLFRHEGDFTIEIKLFLLSCSDDIDFMERSARLKGVSVCVFVVCPFQRPPPPASLSSGNSSHLCEHLQARPALSSLLPAGFGAPGNANCQCRCFIGSGCMLRLSLALCCQVTLKHYKT